MRFVLLSFGFCLRLDVLRFVLCIGIMFCVCVLDFVCGSMSFCFVVLFGVVFGGVGRALCYMHFRLCCVVVSHWCNLGLHHEFVVFCC